MKKRRWRTRETLAVLFLCLCLLTAGCGGEKGETTEVSDSLEDMQNTEDEVLEEQTGEEQAEKGQTEDEQTEEKTDAAVTEPAGSTGNENFSFTELEGISFALSSGAGGWGSWLVINAEGNFSGGYSDSEMGLQGDGYPKGTYYYSSYYGKLGDPVKLDDYTYEVEIQQLDYENTPDTEEIRDEIRYCYTTAFGLTDTEKLLIYLPGRSVSDLPEDALVFMDNGYSNGEKTVLESYVLYNPVGMYPFVSYIGISDYDTAG